MAEELGPEVGLRVLSTDSEEARSLGIQSAILVCVDGEKIPIKKALNRADLERTIRRYLD